MLLSSVMSMSSSSLFVLSIVCSAMFWSILGSFVCCSSVFGDPVFCSCLFVVWFSISFK